MAVQLTAVEEPKRVKKKATAEATPAAQLNLARELLAKRASARRREDACQCAVECDTLHSSHWDRRRGLRFSQALKACRRCASLAEPASAEAKAAYLNEAYACLELGKFRACLVACDAVVGQS